MKSRLMYVMSKKRSASEASGGVGQMRSCLTVSSGLLPLTLASNHLPHAEINLKIY